MKASFLRYLPLLLCLLLTACVTDSVNPLSSPAKSQADPLLVGDWRTSGRADPGICRFSITHGAWMHVEFIPDDKSSKPDPEDVPDSYDFFPTVIGKNTFLNIVYKANDAKGKPTATYLIVRYKIAHQHVLKMWMMDQDEFATAIHAGKIKGHVNEGRYNTDVTLEDTGSNLSQFIQGSNVHELFDEDLDPLTRVKPKGK